MLLNTWCVVSSLNKCNISLFRKTELNQILLRQAISFCKSRQEYRRQGICTAILRCISLPKLLSKNEDAHVDRFGDRRGNTKAHEGDPMSADYDQMKLYDSLNSSFRAIKFRWLPDKIITDRLQSCFYNMWHAINNEEWTDCEAEKHYRL